MHTIIESKPYLGKIGKKAYTTSRLLIPRKLLDFYLKQCAWKGSRANYLHYLIQTYGRHLALYGLFPFAMKYKKKYQEEGLDLQQCDFVPEPSDWEELRNLGFAYGLAMCKFFVILLELDKMKWEAAGYPENFRAVLPRAPRKRPNKRNSVYFKAAQGKNNLKNFLFARHSTSLARVVDREEEFLLRIGWYSS